MIGRSKAIMDISAKLRGKSKKSAKRRHGTPDETSSGKDLGNFTGIEHSRITAHFHAALAGYSTATYDPIAAFQIGRAHV